MFMFLNFFTIALFVVSSNLLWAESFIIQDKKSNKEVVFTDECTEQGFQEIVDFLVEGHAREYRMSGIELPARFEELARAQWASYYVEHFLQHQPTYPGYILTARVDETLVGACAFYATDVECRGATALTLCIVDIFSECEKYEPRLFMKGYRSLAEKLFPYAVRWLGSARIDASRHHEAFNRAGFKQTTTRLPHLSRPDQNMVFFTRRVRKPEAWSASNGNYE